MLKIKEVAKAKGVTITELAERLGITQVTLSRTINGNNPKLDTLLKIASVLDVDVRELITPTKTQGQTEIFKKVGEEYISIGFLKD